MPKVISEEKSEYGKNGLYPNTFQFPNLYVDQIMHMLTPEEFVVLSFSIRQILGWVDHRVKRRARIALSVFVSGYETEQGERLSYGTGLSINTIKKCLESLCSFGLLFVVSGPNDDGTEYELNFDKSKIDMLGLFNREQGWRDAARKRTEKSVEAMHKKRVSCDDRLGVSCDDSPGYHAMIGTKPIVNQENQEYSPAQNSLTPLVRENTPTNARSQSLHSGKKSDVATPEYIEQEDEMQSDSVMPTQIEPLFDETPTPPAKPRSMEEIKAGIANACAEYERKTAAKKRKGRSVADPYEQANEEQRYWAAKILSVMVDNPVAADDMKTVALSSSVNDCVYKARNLCADLQAGRVTKEKLESAFAHLMNGGGERYRKMASVSANMVVTDVSNLCLKGQHTEDASDRTMRALGLK